MLCIWRISAGIVHYEFLESENKNRSRHLFVTVGKGQTSYSESDLRRDNNSEVRNFAASTLLPGRHPIGL